MYRWVYLPKRENFKPEEVVYKSEMPFDGTTSYKTHFPKHDVELRKDYTPKEVIEPPDQPFEGKTQYNNMYRWVYLPERENFKPEEVVYKSEMLFDGTTSYKTQFPKHDVELRKDYTLKKCMSHQTSLLRVKHSITVCTDGCICQRERILNPKKYL